MNTKSNFFKKIKTEHTIMVEFFDILKKIEKLESVDRIIPWRINRQQKWSSYIRFSFSYKTISWLKYKMSKWSTSQELFVICKKWKEDETIWYISDFLV